jgi:hypothetical protein
LWCDVSAQSHLIYLCRAFENGKYAKALYTYDMTKHRYLYLEDAVRSFKFKDTKIGSLHINSYIAVGFQCFFAFMHSCYLYDALSNEAIGIIQSPTKTLTKLYSM